MPLTSYAESFPQVLSVQRPLPPDPLLPQHLIITTLEAGTIHFGDHHPHGLL